VQVQEITERKQAEDVLWKVNRQLNLMTSLWNDEAQSG
jgi:hypothetical protein